MKFSQIKGQCTRQLRRGSRVAVNVHCHSSSAKSLIPRPTRVAVEWHFATTATLLIFAMSGSGGSGVAHCHAFKLFRINKIG